MESDADGRKYKYRPDEGKKEQWNGQLLTLEETEEE